MLQVLNLSGHALQEDQPDKVAEVIGGFLVKQRITTSLNGQLIIIPVC